MKSSETANSLLFLWQGSHRESFDCLATGQSPACPCMLVSGVLTAGFERSTREQRQECKRVRVKERSGRHWPSFQRAQYQLPRVDPFKFALAGKSVMISYS